MNSHIQFIIVIEMSKILDAPHLESEQGNIKYAFISREPLSWFDFRVRSFQTPATFEWPDALHAELVNVTNDVTYYRVSSNAVDITEAVTFDVTGRNGENGPLFSTIQIRVEQERE